VFSPSEPTAGSVVTFNGLTSTAAAGRRIVGYSWDFGDPNDRTPGSGPQTQHRYAAAGGYNVTLTVTDDLGRTSSLAQTVDVK
jgi:PKD repeat protein